MLCSCFAKGTLRWDISDGINLFLQYKKLKGYFAALSEVF